MDIELTKMADKMICIIYREFLERIESGKSKDEACLFGDIFELQSTILPEWYEDDINDALSELSDIGFVRVYVNSSFLLLNPAIIYMETRFSEGLKEVLSFITQFIP